jgi:hypothetical protein
VWGSEGRGADLLGSLPGARSRGGQPPVRARRAVVLFSLIAQGLTLGRLARRLDI